MMNFPERTKGVVALIALSLVFASMGLFVRYLNTGFLIIQQVYLRIAAAAIIGLIVFNKDLHFSKLKQISFKDWGLLVFRAITMYLLGVTLFSVAILETKYSSVSFIGALPVTAIYGFILLKEKVSWLKILFILLAFIGVVIISVKDFSQILLWGKGEFITLLATLSFSLSYIARKWQSELLNNKEITQLTLSIAAILLFILSILFGEPLPIKGWNLGLLLAVFGAGLFNVVNQFLTNYGFQKVEAVLASNLLTLEALFAVILGYIFYREAPNLKELLGGILIIIGVIKMNQLENKVG